jgi:hypothetical protein
LSAAFVEEHGGKGEKAVPLDGPRRSSRTKKSKRKNIVRVKLSKTNIVRVVVAAGEGSVIEEREHEREPADVLLVSTSELEAGLPERVRTRQQTFDNFVAWVLEAGRDAGALI